MIKLKSVKWYKIKNRNGNARWNKLQWNREKWNVSNSLINIEDQQKQILIVDCKTGTRKMWKGIDKD
jgi:hypothetical protein